MTRIIAHPSLTDQTVGPLTYAHAVAERGLHGIYLPEHTHIPADFRAADYPTGQPVPDRYRRLLDPIIALSFIAAHLDLEIGTCVGLVAEHDPIALAKSVATLDRLSGGRFTLGVGFGWNHMEFANHSALDPRQRPELVREHIEVMTALWRDELATYDGKFRTLSPSWAWPKPVQAPRPPVLLGARGTRRNFERIATWADGWISPDHSLFDPGYPEALRLLRTLWAEHGRELDMLQVMALENPHDDDGVIRQYDRARDLGVSGLILHLEDRPLDIVLPVLDEVAGVLS